MTTNLNIKCPNCGQLMDDDEYKQREDLVREGLKKMAIDDARLGISRSPSRDVELYCIRCKKGWCILGRHL